MNFLEKDLEQIIFEADKAELQERGLPIHGKLFRQLKIGNYGIADLVSVEKLIDGGYPYLAITVYELKKDKIGVSAFLQALGYLKGIEQYLDFRGFGQEVEFNICLIGKELDLGSTFIYLTDFVSSTHANTFVNQYVYSYGIDGLYFERKYGYKLVEHNFKHKERIIY